VAFLRVTAIEYRTPSGDVERIIVRRLGEWAMENHLHLAKRDFEVLQTLEPLGLGSPRPLLFDDSGTIFPDPYFVTEYIVGEPRHEVAGGVDRAAKMAQRLALIHSCPPLDNLPDRSENYNRLVSKRPEKLNQELLEPLVRDALDAVWPLPPPKRASLIHGDFWPGNVLWQDGEITGVIDWEEAGIGDLLYDLAISRLDTFWAYGEEAMQAVTARYLERTGCDLSQLPYWDLVVALRPMQQLEMWAAASPDLDREDMTQEMMAEGLKRFIRGALSRLC
jgi:aminoglycoside phosphotransferase (APT) family kinase protein